MATLSKDDLLDSLVALSELVEDDLELGFTVRKLICAAKESGTKLNDTVARFNDMGLKLHNDDYVLISTIDAQPVESLDVIYNQSAVDNGDANCGTFEELVKMTALPPLLKLAYMEDIYERRTAPPVLYDKNNVAFDDFVENELHHKGETNWSQVCIECEIKHKFDLIHGVATDLTCGVKGCSNKAEYYYDFTGKLAQ